MIPPDAPYITPTLDIADLTPPPEIQSILDEASDLAGEFSALVVIPDTMRLIRTRTKEVVREAKWAGLYAWSKNVLGNTLQAVQAQPGSPTT